MQVPMQIRMQMQAQAQAHVTDLQLVGEVSDAQNSAIQSDGDEFELQRLNLGARTARV